MNWFKNLRIAKKLMLSYGLIIVLSCVLGIIAVKSMSRMNADAFEVGGRSLPSINAASDMETMIERYRRRELNFGMAENEEERSKAANNLEQARVATVEAMKKYEKLISKPQTRALFDKISQDWDKLMAASARIRALGKEDKHAELKALLMGESLEIFTRILESMDQIIDINTKVADKAFEESVETYHDASTLIISLLVFTIIFSLWFAYLIARMIANPLGRAVDIAKTVAAGDLRANIDADSTDETGQLISALKDMNDSLVRIVGEVRQRSESIASASGEIATGNLDLSSRTEQQASSLEETAASMEELTTTVRQNGENARQANQLAVAASEVATRGGTIVGEVVTTMSSINDSSKKIADITSVIDGIAFQTNILALNAAVEAARAGEQGRGFAVVAAEVRNLAQRSGAAAKDIKTLIDDSVERINSGTALVDQAGETMAEIVSSVKHVTDIVAEITASSKEQTAGIEQINVAITEMDNATQQNAALVEQAAAASESLQEQAVALNTAVSTFKLGDRADTASTMKGPAPRKAAAAGAHATGKRAAGKPTLRLASSPAGNTLARASSKPEQPHGGSATKVATTKASNDDWEEF